MLHHLSLAIRHLWKRKLYTIIILLSLTISFSGANLLISFLVAELNTDSFHPNKDITFQFFSTDPFDGANTIAFIPDYVGDYMTSAYPEVKSVCRIANFENATLESENGEFDGIQILTTDTSFFTFFNFPLSKNHLTEIFSPEKILLTREKARILFSDGDAVGKTITLKIADTTRTLTVSGLIDRAPENSHLIFEAVVDHGCLKNKWKGGATYVMLNSAGQSEQLIAKINQDINRPGLLGPASVNYSLQPLVESHFNGANKMAYMKTRDRILIVVGFVVCVLILLIGSFNFVNLFLLSLQERSKETGIRKTLGAIQKNLLKGLLAETSIYIIVAFLGSIVLSNLLLPTFNTTLEASLLFSYLSRAKVLFIIGVIVFFIAATSVFFSSIKQMKMPAVSLMRGNAAPSKISFSKFLFTLQFVISIAMTICVSTIILQMNFIKNESLGFNRNIIQLKSPDKSLSSRLPALKEKLIQIPRISHTALASGNPISGNMIARYDLEDKSFYTPYLFSGDKDLIKTLDLKLLSGELFSETNKGCLVNEKLVQQFGFKNPIGEFVPGTKDQIIGVVRNFTCGSFKEAIPPVIISYRSNSNCLLIDFNNQLTQDLTDLIRKAWKDVFPEYAFEYQVIQQELLKKYKEDIFFFRLMIAFSVASLIISCFGLFAVSWSVVQLRSKEIGIRKVVGANGWNIFKLMTLSFLSRIVIAFFIAAPIAYFLMERWLEHFVKHITVSPWILISSAMVILVVSLATMSIQLIKAVLTNPVDKLRAE